MQTFELTVVFYWPFARDANETTELMAHIMEAIEAAGGKPQVSTIGLAKDK